jgi:hypothetical protein
MKDYLGLPIFLIVSTWGILKLELDTVQILNTIRNYCLG